MALSGFLPKTQARSGAPSEAISMMPPELQGCKRGIEVSCVRSECNPATPWPFFKYGPPLRGCEPMSNHDCCALVRHAIERLPPQPFALGVERGLRLTQHQRRCVLRLRVIARRWRWPTERSLRACQPCAVFFSWRCAVKQSAVALVATCRPASSEVSGRTKQMFSAMLRERINRS